MTTPQVPHRFEYELEVQGSADEVWHAIATARGISSWMLPTQLEPHVGGAVTFEMGPDSASHGQVTAYEPSQRIVYEEDWATLVGHPDADVTPLVTEFLVEARSGGTCTVRVVSSAFGSGADWENEFWADMETGWAPMLDNLRIYLAHFHGQEASDFMTSATFPTDPDSSIASVRAALGIGSPGDEVAAPELQGVVERSMGHHFLVRTDHPAPGLLSFFCYGVEAGAEMHVHGYLFGDGAPATAGEHEASWKEWLDRASAGMGAAAQ